MDRLNLRCTPSLRFYKGIMAIYNGARILLNSNYGRCRLNRYPSAIPATLQTKQPSEAFFNRAQHHILYRFFVIASSARCSVNELPVAAALREDHPQLSPLSQRNSKLAEHQCRLLSATATRPLWARYCEVQPVYFHEADAGSHSA